jgi:hypothetical protein
MTDYTNLKIEDSRLINRVKNAIAATNEYGLSYGREPVLTLGDLSKLSDAELLRYPGIAKIGVAHIRDVLDSYNITNHAKPKMLDRATLRDQFAMSALTSMLSPVQDIRDGTPDLAAKLAYRFADAMLEARGTV